MYYIYLLRCADDSLYTGITTDPERRFAEHAGHGGKGAKYTAAHHAVRIEAVWTAPDRSVASKLEYRIKTMTKAEKEKLVRDGLPDHRDYLQYAKAETSGSEGNKSMLFVCYPKCTTCQKARAFLDAHKIAYEFRDIKLENPTEEELRRWHAKSGLPLKKLFNTSGLQYRALSLSARLPDLSEEEQYALLASDGMLIKRPILVSDGWALVGFHPAAWESKL